MTEIGSEITRVGLLGWPVGHSVSPAMHNAAFAARGMSWDYTKLAVPPDQFESEVARLVGREGYRGFNVTIPHKQAAFRLPGVEAISPAAHTIGAVNTLSVRPGGTLSGPQRLHADNTDWQGFARDLAAHEISPAGAICLILGSGGSARAIGYALRQGGAASITQISRDPGGRAHTAGYGDLTRLAPGADLIVNCTPCGMSPHVDQSPWPDDVPFPPGAVLYDLIYNPPVTRLMRQAQDAGARAINGLGMLVWQGALAFELWTGRKPPVGVMHDAAAQALEQLIEQS